MIDSETKLNINIENRNCIGFCFDKKSKVVVYLPESYDKNITISNNYGDVDIESFENAKINIEEDCGDVFVEAASEVDIKNNLGDVEVRKILKANIESDCGDIKLGSVNDIVIKNSLGDVKIDNINNYLDITADCGDIKLDTVVLTKNSKIVNNLGDVKIQNIKDVYIDAKTDLGDVKINNNYHKSDINLNIQNDCGDIKVEN